MSTKLSDVGRFYSNQTGGQLVLWRDSAGLQASYCLAIEKDPEPLPQWLHVNIQFDQAVQWTEFKDYN